MRPSTFGSAMRCVSCRAEDWPKATLGRKRTTAHSARPFFILSSLRYWMPYTRYSGLRFENQDCCVCVEDNQLRRGTNAVEEPMMALIERERDIRLNSCRPGLNLLALLEINHSKLGCSGKRNVSLRRRFFNLDTAGPGIGIDIRN